ncbi:MAG: hypothetical protein CL535_18510 [Ahrensia sp.]|nr:hypothetical protein [Ahrensia sp.]|tara:strand:+ start:23804 stop:24532 length:729 start_codon:yes stop_codon:yes gene_type:complete
MRTLTKMLVAAFACGAASLPTCGANAQDTSSPIFSTPATRSPSTVPVLEDKTNRGGSEIIQSVGGGTRRVDTKPQNEKAEAQKDATGEQVESAEKTASPETRKFGSWTQECLTQAAPGPQCQIVLRVASADGKQIVLVFSLAKMPENESYQFQMAVPLGISVSQGIELRVDTGYSTTINVARCTPQGCIGEGQAAEPMLQAMRDGAKASAIVRGADQKPISIGFSLVGFTKAVESLEGGQVD